MLQARRSRVRYLVWSLDFSIDLILPALTMTLGSTLPLTEMSIRNLPGGEGRPARKIDNLTAIRQPIAKKMWEPRCLTILWACTTRYRDSFTFYLRFHNHVTGDVMNWLWRTLQSSTPGVEMKMRTVLHSFSRVWALFGALSTRLHSACVCVLCQLVLWRPLIVYIIATQMCHIKQFYGFFYVCRRIACG
jgi:hypothetical protein